MFELSLKLILAHLIGDFLLQPNKWVKDKKENKVKSKYLYLHIAIHFLLLLVTTKGQYFIAIIIISISHFIIDIVKLYFEKEENNKLWFFIDQLLHFAIITCVVYYYYPYTIKINAVYESNTLVLLTALVSVTYVSSIILKHLLLKWSSQIKTSENDDTNNAGKYIGILERLFIFYFVIINFWEGIGFLLAAKSIFRFDSLKDSKDVKLTEYILIGTLLSFGLGICCALIYKYIIAL